MLSRMYYVLLFAFIVLASDFDSNAAQQKSSVEIFAAHRGINIFPPFERGDTSGFHGLHRYVSPQVIRQLARVGVDLVRLPVNPAILLRNSGLTREALESEILSAADEFVATGIAVVIDLHFWDPEDPVWNGNSILNEADGPGFYAFRELVKQLGIYMYQRPHGTVALELLNEPPACRTETSPNWDFLQRNLIAEVRSVAPELPIVAAGCGGQLEGLRDLTNAPFDDPNMLYTFHFYDPFIYTHQSTDQYYPLIRHLPYPAFRGSLEDALKNVLVTSDEIGLHGIPKQLAILKAEREVRRYFAQNADISFIKAQFKEIKDWASHVGIASNRILLGEFAALDTRPYVTTADYESQLRWIEDVRQTADEYGFSYTYWKFNDSRGPLVDPVTLTLHPNLGPALGFSARQLRP